MDIKSARGLTKEQIETINKLMLNLQYGNIVLIVQDGKLIQVDKTEKHRLRS